ncbi:hypothetical protein GCM10022286_31220 [Gryllotalpicola daejeonensis]|uniref:Uncharacterized protein n=1 Tax=Gryllotalpicola daejeonensis TaxID=993087 RepID=A0ABP7ZNT3_9MICO
MKYGDQNAARKPGAAVFMVDRAGTAARVATVEAVAVAGAVAVAVAVAAAAAGCAARPVRRAAVAAMTPAMPRAGRVMLMDEYPRIESDTGWIRRAQT